MSIGGTRETFWHLTPREIEIDFRAHSNRVNEQLQLAWATGKYVKMAIQSSVMVCTLADNKTLKSMPDYPDMPRQENKEEVMSEKEIETKRQLMIAKMLYWQRQNNKRFKNKKEV